MSDTSKRPSQSPKFRLFPAAFSAFCCSLTFLFAACGGDSDAVGGGGGLEGSLGDASVREQCVASGVDVRAVDLNNDGTYEVRNVYAGSVLRCSEHDIDADGVVDSTIFYDANGQYPVREERDFDYDGKLDQISYYEEGQIVRQELVTSFGTRVGVWIWCDAGRAARAERDRNNDGAVDTWEEYDTGLLISAAYDDNNDALPERWEIFEAGRLVEIRHDLDRDGNPDRSESVSREAAGEAETRINCQPMEEPPPPAQPPPAETGEETSEEGTTEGEGSHHEMDPDAPWAGASDVSDAPEGETSSDDASSDANNDAEETP